MYSGQREKTGGCYWLRRLVHGCKLGVLVREGELGENGDGARGRVSG